MACRRVSVDDESAIIIPILRVQLSCELRDAEEIRGNLVEVLLLAMTRIKEGRMHWLLLYYWSNGETIHVLVSWWHIEVREA